MAQKQKLKSERGRLNEGIKDMFMTMDPDLFRDTAKAFAYLRDTYKPGHNLLLETFEENKKNKPSENSVKDVIKMRIIHRNKMLNELLSILLAAYWTCQDKYDGGYFWCMMPTKKANESNEQYKIRRERMEDNLMQVMLEVLDDCNYYIKGTLNSQKTQK